MLELKPPALTHMQSLDLLILLQITITKYIYIYITPKDLNYIYTDKVKERQKFYIYK